MRELTPLTRGCPMTTEPQHGPSPGDAPLPGAVPGAEAPQPTPGLAPDGQPPRPPPAAPEQAAPPVATALPQHRIKRTRTGGLWVAVGFFAVVLLLLLIFILQNGTQVSVSYLGLHGRLPLGVALLLAAVCGVLLVVLAGAARISQLRAVARRHRRADAKRVAATQPTGESAGPVR
jgi:lipopolysaccharide assembly protein A